MKSKMKLISMCALVFMLLSSLQLSALALQLVDPDALGSITVTMKNASGESIGGGTLALYRVAKVTDDYEYELLSAFKECGGEDFPDNISTTEFTDEVEECILKYDVACSQIAGIETDGYAYFSDVQTGIYLISQIEAADGYMNINSFIVTVPFNENGELIYDVNASPKVTPAEMKETETIETNPQTEPKTTTPTGTTTGTTTTSTPTATTSTPATTTSTGDKIDTTLPQTGALLWPIILTAVLGMVCIAGGIYLNREKKTEKVKNAE